MSLNPVVHIDPIGTLLLPLIAAWSGLPIIGWAKPVPVVVGHLRRGRRDFVTVAAAGPASNLLQAVLAAVIFHLVIGEGGWPAYLCARFVEINLLLAFFNLVPVPPLDGGNVLAGLLPEGAEPLFAMLRQYGFIILYVLMLTGVLSYIVLPPTWLFRSALQIPPSQVFEGVLYQ